MKSQWIRLYIHQIPWYEVQFSYRGVAKASLSCWEATGLFSSFISHCWSGYIISIIWTSSVAVLLGLCMLPCSIQIRHVARLHFVGNEFTSEWITKFSHQKEVLRPDVVMLCRMLCRDSSAAGRGALTAPVLKGSLIPGAAFSLAICTCAAVCSPTPFPLSCSSHVALLLPNRMVNLAFYLKASEPLSLIVSTEDVNIN